MDKIKSSEIQIGMRFSAPVFFDDGANMFLAEKKPVTAFHTSALSRWKIPYVITYGKILTDDEMNDGDLEELDELDSLEPVEELSEERALEPSTSYLEKIAENLSQVDQALKADYCGCLKSLQSIFSLLKQDKEILRSDIDLLIDTIYKMVFANSLEVIGIVMTSNSEFDFANSALNCAILSSSLALQIGLNKRQIQQLIAASLLHDQGMLAASEQVLQKKSQLSENEYNLIKLHPTRSARYASETLFFPNDVAVIIQQHHECWDGSGYPRSLKGEKIDYSARILAIADSFTAMISKKSYRDSINGYDAIKTLMADTQRHFDPEILQSFISLMGIYPMSTIVKLNNNAIAQVIEPNREMPFMPNVRILAEGPNNHEFQIGDVVLLKEKRNLCITKVIKPNECQISA